MRRKSPIIKQNILDFVSTYSELNGFSPSVREIGAAVGLRSTSGVLSYIKELVEDGSMRKVPAKSRAIDTTEAGGGVVYPLIPLMKGYSSDVKFFDPANIAGRISVPLPRGADAERFFAIKAYDGSMSDAGICKRDIVIAELPEKVDDGACVICIWNEKLYVRNIFLEGQNVRLVPSGRGYSDELAPSCKVIGLVVGAIHYGKVWG